MNDDLEDARLTVVAMVRASLRGDEAAYNLLLDTAPDMRAVARVACGMASTLMSTLPDELAQRALDQFTVSEGNDTPAGVPKPPRQGWFSRRGKRS